MPDSVVTAIDALASPASQFQFRSAFQCEIPGRFPACSSTMRLGVQNSVQTVENLLQILRNDLSSFMLVDCCTQSIAPISYVDVSSLPD